MKNKILVVYQFATFGGVERILLNRAEALKFFGLNYKLYLYFYEDFGAKMALRQYIAVNELEEHICIIDEFNPKDFDYIVSIDTPQIFEHDKVDSKEVIVETHTIEKQYRDYLDEYIGKVNKVLVPSQSFYNLITEEYKKACKNVEILNNFVPWDLKDSSDDLITLPEWNKNIIFYFGRVDENKNIKELVMALDYYVKEISENIILLIVGNIDPEYKLNELIEKLNIGKYIVFLPPINFDKMSILLNTLKKEKSIFISPSKGETFGLSAAETISHGIPIILSDIDAHLDLVDSKSEYIYKLGEYKDLSDKISFMFNNYDKLTNNLEKTKNKFSADNFKKEWQSIFPEKY